MSGADRLRRRDLAGVGIDLLGGRLDRFAPAGASVLQAIALAVHLDDMDVVGGEKVGHGSGGVVLLRGARKGSQWLA